MKLFLDDIRFPKDCISYMYTRIGDLNPIYLEPWTIVRDYMEFLMAVTKHYKEITHISFDHDLAESHYTSHGKTDERGELIFEYEYEEGTGYHCAKWLKQFYKEKNLSLPVMFVHSMNPVGTQNIINVFK